MSGFRYREDLQTGHTSADSQCIFKRVMRSRLTVVIPPVSHDITSRRHFEGHCSSKRLWTAQYVRHATGWEEERLTVIPQWHGRLIIQLRARANHVLFSALVPRRNFFFAAAFLLFLFGHPPSQCTSTLLRNGSFPRIVLSILYNGCSKQQPA